MISTERVFSLSCFEGLKLVRKYSLIYPDHTPEDIVRLIQDVEADGLSLDLNAAVYLETLIEIDCPADGPVFYQSCIKAVLLKHQPIWSKTMKHGRKRFIRSLNQGDQDIFAAAGLLDEPIGDDIVCWWDEVSSHARLILDQGKVERGRQAEILTIAHEKDRLKKLGIQDEPEWPGLDDNFAGYDVLSYDKSAKGIVNKLIEVKSSISSPISFFVSRNEWGQAEKVGESYLFHVWDMSKEEPILHVRSVDEVSKHIPSDKGKGQWTVASIPIGGSA